MEDTYPDPSGDYPPVPKALIKALIREKIVTFPLAPETDLALKILAKIWAYEDTPRLVLRSVRKRDRAALLENIDLSRRDRYVISLINNSEGKVYSVKKIRGLVYALMGTGMSVKEVLSLKNKALYRQRKKENLEKTDS